jgi:hypothetical protein
MVTAPIGKQRSEKGILMFHSSSPEVANIAKRSEAPTSNSEVAEIYQCYRLG